MNRGRARKLIRKAMRLHLKRSYLLTCLEQEIFGGSPGDVILTDPKKMEELQEACKPEAVAAWEQKHVNGLLAEKDDLEAFEKIVESFCWGVIDEDDITNELCDALISALQKHFAGIVMFGDGDEPGSGDHLFVYEPNPDE